MSPRSIFLSLLSSASLGLAAHAGIAINQQQKENLLPNPEFAPASGGGIRSWTPHPQDTRLIRAFPDDGVHALEMSPGAMNLSIASRPVSVEGGKSYTLAFEVKQEDIHIGFGMGSKATLVWSLGNGSRLPEFTDTVDGSFDWETFTHGVTAPADAKTVVIRLAKSGSPGRVFFRRPAFVPGILMRSTEDLTAKDFIRAIAAFDFISVHLADFLADKEGLAAPELDSEPERIRASAAAMAQKIREDAGARKVELTGRDEIIWNEMLKGVLGFRLSPSSPYYDAWAALDQDVKKFREGVEHGLLANNRERLAGQMRKVFGDYQGFALGVDSSMLKVRRNVPYAGNAGAEAFLALARNEEESMQITLTALDRDLRDVRVEVTPLAGSDGAMLTGEAVQVHRIDFVKTNPPAYYAEPPGWWPDVVFPANRSDEIRKGTNQSFWITVATDAQTPAGDYRGEILVKEGDVLLGRVTLNVRVWDITLPRPGKFAVIGCFHPYMLKDFYRWDKIKEDVIAKWNRFIIRKRWNPTLYFSKGITPSGEALKASLDEGLNAINLLDPSKFLERDESRTYAWPTPEQEKAMVEAIQKAREDFRAAGGTDKTRLFLSGFDEQHDRGQYKLMRHVFDLAKKAAPEAKTLTSSTYPPLDDLARSVDIWVPLLGKDGEEMKKRQAAGDEVHFYVYAHPFRPYPNPSLIDYPGIDSRITFWLAARQDYTGFFHYLFNGWKPNNLEGPRWPRADWLPYSDKNQSARNGAGYFLYPGPDEQPVSSVRMELVRDGIEDWELIQMLKDAIAEAEAKTPDAPALTKAKQALEAGMKLVPALDKVSNNMRQLLDARTEVAEALMALQKSK